VETYSVQVDRVRYVRVMRFFVGALLSIIWWDVVLRRLPGIGNLAARTSTDRWCRIARRFRRLAVELGGVLIKLGQFLSIRVDVFPPEVISELAGLQDEVPAEGFPQVQAVIAEEFGRPADAVFAWMASEPDAAASLAQVHRARLVCGSTGDGVDGAGELTEVVVKVQRTDMRRVVETDLAAIRTAGKWLRWYPPIRRRVDPDRLLEEFANTTRAELDFVAEGKNAERFAADFADDPGIVIPRIYWEYTTPRVLTMDNVAAIKITDRAAIEAAGISPGEVARRVYRAYLRQVFVTNFVHADPHPGNLFVRPAGGASPMAESAPSESVAHGAAGSDGRPFQIVFVDFGMVAVVPERLRAQARDCLIGLATRDAHRIVQAYIDADVLLPGADRQRLEEAHEALLKRLYGMKLGQLSHMAFAEAEFLWREYRDILFEMPFQVPCDVLFVARSLGILAGIATSLYPDFDPWAETIPFAQRLARQELGSEASRRLDDIVQALGLMWTLPTRLDRLLTQAERGQMTTVVSLAPDAARMLQRVDKSIERLSWGVMFTSLLIAGVILRVNEGPGWISTALLAAAGLSLVWGLTRR
jgi:predicted unusual protein kinase regulating ubiquinone biosynthesis (AarF/ABC1/UbiB family)